VVTADHRDIAEAPLPASYFEGLYTSTVDPWGFGSRWYEERKRQITVASLPRAHFRNAFEPGCSGGWLSADLASRCDRLLATDVSDRAVAIATERLAVFTHVEVRRGQVPQDWPSDVFDLIVISEMAYYCDRSGALSIGRQARESLTREGYLLLCHWRHPVSDYPLAGDEAQQLVKEGSGLTTAVHHLEEDFVLEVLAAPGAPSVARAQGLVGP
jgi:Nodulation protein S (NodS)